MTMTKIAAVSRQNVWIYPLHLLQKDMAIDMNIPGKTAARRPHDRRPWQRELLLYRPVLGVLYKVTLNRGGYFAVDRDRNNACNT